MQIVIDISEHTFNHIHNGGNIGASLLIENAIKNGTPLPKGHGRITDIDKVLEEMKATRTYDIPFALERVKPIIEADKEREVNNG